MARRRCTDEDVLRLRKIVTTCERHFADHRETKPDEYYQINLDFHRLIADSAGNETPAEMIMANA